jgi:release factor glutamine methyltransferase
LYANPENIPEPESAERYRSLLRRRAAGEPVAYLTGRREFWSLTLNVNPEVLIPRPETELLVETVLKHVPVDARWRIADLGTGSGAIALAIARERTWCEVHATDVSQAALAVAETNAQALAPGRVRFHLGSWLGALDGTFRVIVSNPPYIAENDPHATRGDCRFEPSGALVSGPDGLDAIREIASGAMSFLDPGGMMALEHGFDQGARVRDLLECLGYAQVTTEFDLEGHERVTMGSRPG